MSTKTKLLIALLGLITLESGSADAFGHVYMEFGDNGLNSIRYAGLEYLAFGDLRVLQANFQPLHGSPIAGDPLSKTTIDASHHRVTHDFSWGSVEISYKIIENRLLVSLKIVNATSGTLTDLWIQPFGLRFPSRVKEYDGKVPLLTNSIGQPALVKLSHDAGTIVVVSEDLDKPLQIGFPWMSEPATNSFPLSINTGRVPSFPNGCPTIRRPIPAKGSDSFHFSLRFGPQGASLETLAGDAFEGFAKAFPSTLHWKDRRAIGDLFLSTSATGWKTNPRGWLMDPKIDVTTPEGIAALKQRILDYADGSVSILKKMNAQGAITWDIEGQEYPHAASYIGDPRMFETLAPEMLTIADDYFKRFRDAGLQVGVCIRPQKVELAPDRSKVTQAPVDDPLPLLIEKVRYAKTRWEATLFYVDSNVNADDLNAMDASIFRKLAAAFPDSLFIPEHSTMAYHAYTAPYRELRQNKPSTPREIRFVYPDSFSVINTSDGPMDKLYDEVLAGVKHGDVLMFRAWFDDPQNAKDSEIYQKAAHPWSGNAAQFFKK